MMKNLGLLVACFCISWLTYDVRDYYNTRPVPYEVHGYYGPSDPSQMQLADYFTPFGGLPPADGTSVCATGTATSLCPTIASGTTANDVIGWNFTQTGATSAGANLNGGVVGVVNPNVANVNTMSFTGGVATSPYTFSFASTAAKPVIVFNTTGTCTGANVLINFQNSGTSEDRMGCNGNLTVSGTVQAAGAISTTVGNISTTANPGIVQEEPSNTGGLLTQALAIYTMTPGGVLTAASAYRAIVGQCAFSASTTCDTSTQAGGAVWGQPFTSASTYSCMITSTTTTTGPITWVQSTNKIVMTAVLNSSTVPYICIGN